MSESGSSVAFGSSFSSSQRGSPGSDNTDTRALNSLQESPDGEDVADAGSTNKPLEALFATVYTLTRNAAMDTSLRIAALRIVLEFLQFFRVVFNFSFPWTIRRDLGIFKAVEWALPRALVAVKGYDLYIMVFYVTAGAVLGTLALTACVAVLLKGSESVNPWLKRLIGTLRLVALVVFCVAFPTVLDISSFLVDCRWTYMSQGLPVTHVHFTEQSCTSMPHLAHMIFAVIIVLITAAMVVLMGVGMCDTNPLTTTLLDSSNEVTILKVALLKVVFVVVSTALDEFGGVQAVLMAVTMWGCVYYLLDGVPYYNKAVNCIYAGLWSGILDASVVLLVMQVTIDRQEDPAAYSVFMTNVVLYTIFPAMALGAGLMWLRLQQLARLSAALHKFFNVCKAAVLDGTVDDDQAPASGSVLAHMVPADLKHVHRFRDVRQIRILCRAMRKWDEDGEPEPDAVEFGEFLLKCGLARMPNNPSLLVVLASFMLEARADGQGARTQLQLAQKNKPSLIETYSIYACQQLAKKLQPGGDGLDLLSYVEFQRSYIACVHSHRVALTAQKAFWNSLLRDTISIKDLQANVKAMEAAEQRATAVYRRVMERYPGNSKLMKIYGRFLEYVRCETSSASRYYEAALKQGSTDSLLALASSSEGAAAGLAAAGQIDEKTDGLAVINATGSILMVNPACLTMFGYTKGELEGKNVSMLMPQPISSKHDGFLQRYVETGQARILSKTRGVVGLHKNRVCFPLSLCVARLSGVGSDTLFIGVMKHEPSIGTLDKPIMRFWTTSSGIIMCCDNCVTDALGQANAADFIGRSFSSLCTDVGGVNTYLAAAATADEATEPPTFKTQMSHAFLPPVDVELSLTFGGHTDAHSDCRNIILHAHVLTDSTAVMVLDHKGRIQHATAKLAGLLGYPVSKHRSLDFNTLLPQAVCQMHGAWFKDLAQRIPATSCRAGAVVHLQAANGTMLPVTLNISSKEDMINGRVSHVVQVAKATEQQRLNQQRMTLSLNHFGAIIGVNSGVPKSLFGFDGTQLVGRPLSSVIDIFKDFQKAGAGDELSLQELLVAQMLASTDPAANISLGTACASWRVGVQQPSTDGDSTTAMDPHSGSLLRALQPSRSLAVCMTLEAIQQEAGEMLYTEATTDDTPVLQVTLHRSDALTALVDIDAHLKISRADDAAGLMFGVSSESLVNKSLARLLGLAGVAQFDDLFGKQGGAKKGAMKNAAVASRAGEIRRITTTHLGDGQPLTLTVQAMSYSQGGHSRRVVRLQVVSPVSAAMEMLLAIKAGKHASPHALQEPVEAVRQSDSPAGSSLGGSDRGNGVTAEPSAADARPVQGGKSARIHDWVRQASSLQRRASDSSDGSTARSPRFKGSEQDVPDAEAEVHLVAAPGRRKADAADRLAADAASSDAAASFVEGMSEIGSEAESAMPPGDAAGQEEELAVDMRRAKRLKKLMRMLSSGIAQAATDRWTRHTQFVLAAVLLVHIVSYAVISSQLDARRANAVSVNTIGLSMTAASQSVLRLNLLHKCALPLASSTIFFCSPASWDHGQKLALNTVNFRQRHHDLFLGGHGVQPFRDERLTNFWTYKELPETLYYKADASGLPALVSSNRTLWEMGNAFLNAIEDIYYFRDTWGANMDQEASWQYAFLNGPASLLSGYAWSLDTFVDYCWGDLTNLSIIIVVLLVVEAVFVQMSCMTYEFLLLQRSNVANMRMFSVLLALRSAAVRFIISRPMVIDDNAGDAGMDEDLDLIKGAAGAARQDAGDGAENATKGDSTVPAKKSKSVRMAAEEDDDDDKPGLVAGAGHSSTKLKSKTVAATKSTRPAGFVAFGKRASKLLFGWLDPRFRRNGKKLVPSNTILWKFMVPLLLWLSAVMVIFGVSYASLQGLQGPLASQNLASRVMYRLSRARLAGSLLAFSDSTDKAFYRAELKSELHMLQRDYKALLYGGAMVLEAPVSFNPVAPAAVMQNPALADIFFKTTDCLRADKSTCYKPGDQHYQITHSGLDAQVQRYLDETTTFANLPDNLTVAANVHYGFVFKVTAKDTYEGLQAASELFVAGTLEKLDGVKQLHTILLVVSLCCGALFLLLLYRPYVKSLRRDTKALVSMLSQLPADVDIEGHVKTIVLGFVKPADGGGKSTEGLPGNLAHGPSGQLQQYGNTAWGMGGAGGQRGGWFGRRSSTTGPQGQMMINDPGMYGGMYVT